MDFVKTLKEDNSALNYCIHGTKPFNRYALQLRETPFYVQQWDYQKLTFTSAIEELFSLNKAVKNQDNLINMFR
jgi:hypothetical protein